MKTSFYIACFVAVLTFGVAPIAQDVTSSVSSGIGVVMPPKAVPLDTPVQDTNQMPVFIGGAEPHLPGEGSSSYSGSGIPGAVQGSPPYSGINNDTPVMPTCGYQDLVGKNIKDVNLSALGIVRVLYPDSIVTEDFSPNRINIMLEKGTDIITRVICG